MTALIRAAGAVVAFAVAAGIVAASHLVVLRDAGTEGVLRLAEQFGAARLEAACARALAHASPHYRTVKTILARGFDQRVDVGPQFPEHSASVYAAEARFVRPAHLLFATGEPQP